MCRMFGFRSVLKSRVHRSLLSADNALAVQSRAHPDGWGVAYYVNGVPQVTRSTRTAVSDALFRRISGVVSSETVVAHVRQATQGALSPLNCHPFQYGRWIFAHNGDVPDFASHRTALMAHIVAAYGQCLFVDGFFNADPHAGNLMVQPRGGAAQPVLLDFGMTVRLSHKQRLGYARLAHAAQQMDVAALQAAVRSLGVSR